MKEQKNIGYVTSDTLLLNVVTNPIAIFCLPLLSLPLSPPPTD